MGDWMIVQKTGRFFLFFKDRGCHIYFSIAAVDFEEIDAGSEAGYIKKIIAIKIFMCQHDQPLMPGRGYHLHPDQ